MASAKAKAAQASAAYRASMAKLARDAEQRASEKRIAAMASKQARKLRREQEQAAAAKLAAQRVKATR